MITRAFVCQCDECSHRWLSERIIPRQCPSYKSRDSNGDTTQGGWVYVVGCVGRPLHKIGMTKDPRTRLTSITYPDTKDPVMLHVLIPCEYPDEAEKVLHEHFSEKRVVGEWFALDEHDMEEVREFSFLEESSLIEAKRQKQAVRQQPVRLGRDAFDPISQPVPVDPAPAAPPLERPFSLR